MQAASSSLGREPTAKELQALFDELDELSDSGGEMAPDEVSGYHTGCVDHAEYCRSTNVSS